jgi:hypothetical protein
MCETHPPGWSVNCLQPAMLYTIALILTLVLPLSPLTSYVAEGEAHNLLVVAILGLLIWGVQPKRASLTQ